MKTLGLKTDMIFHHFGAEVTQRKNYTVIKTPDRPTYFWGNYLIFDRPPQAGDLQPWIRAYEKEFGIEQGFMALTWDSTQQGETWAFEAQGFELQTASILSMQSASELHSPQYPNTAIEIRPLRTQRDWFQYKDVHFAPDWPYGSDAGQRQFLSRAAQELRDMGDAGLGQRFGAFLKDELVAELGVYWAGKVGRFNSVGTHRNHRRQGICQTLVHEVSQRMFQKGLETLVIEADCGDPAERIYSSLGFKPTETRYALEWYDKSKF